MKSCVGRFVSTLKSKVRRGFYVVAQGAAPPPTKGRLERLVYAGVWNLLMPRGCTVKTGQPVTRSHISPEEMAPAESFAEQVTVRGLPSRM